MDERESEQRWLKLAIWAAVIERFCREGRNECDRDDAIEVVRDHLVDMEKMLQEFGA